MPTRTRLPLLVLPLLIACAQAETVDTVETSEHDLGAADMMAYLEAKIDIADEKFMSLAEAIPEETWDYAPMEGTRSFRDVFLHIAADNWYGGALMGIPTPDDIGVDDTSESVRAYQDQTLTKAETLEHMRRSFDYFHDAIDQTRDRLGTPAMLRTTETNFGDLWVRLTTHMHEHLGQVIAYSRANEIVPPWSR